MRLGLAEAAFALLDVGKLYPGKRVLDALRALEALEGERFGAGTVTLLVAGDGVEREALRRFATQRGLDVRLLGLVRSMRCRSSTPQRTRWSIRPTANSTDGRAGGGGGRPSIDP